MTKRDRDCLAYDPFGGDRDTRRLIFRDAFVVTRARHVCNVCVGDIPAGARSRKLTEKVEGDMGSSYFCPECCEAMAASWTDNGEAIERRTTLGMKRIDAARRPSRPEGER